MSPVLTCTSCRMGEEYGFLRFANMVEKKIKSILEVSDVILIAIQKSLFFGTKSLIRKV